MRGLWLPDRKVGPYGTIHRNYPPPPARLAGIVAALALAVAALLSPAVARAEGVPTRTTTLDLSQNQTTAASNADEGWSWEPLADGTGGTLTLTNCYIRVASGRGILFPTASGVAAYNVTIELVGANTVESVTEDPHAKDCNTLITNAPAPSTNMHLTIRSTTNGSLDLLFENPASDSAGTYGVNAAQSLSIESGDIYSNTTLCITTGDVSISGGSVTVEANRPIEGAPYADYQDGIYSLQGDVTISGGVVDIDVGRNGIYITGNAAGVVRITGSDVTINAGHPYNSQNCIGIAATNVVIDTDSPVSIHGRDVALASFTGSINAQIARTGVEFSLTKDSGSPFALIYPENDNSTISVCSANFTAVDAAVARAQEIDPSLYANFSDVEQALNAVDRTKTALEQDEVNAMAEAIEAAIAGLEYAPADYTAVDDALAKIPADLSGYTAESAAAVEAARDAVDRTLTVDRQGEVDAMADAIEAALAALEEVPEPEPELEPAPQPKPEQGTGDKDTLPATGDPTALLAPAIALTGGAVLLARRRVA